MRSLRRALSAETLKLKNSLALWLAAIAPLVIAVIQFFILMDRGSGFLNNSSSPWHWLGIQTLIFWSFLMLPLFITLETALVAGLEHSGAVWKHLFVQPVSRIAIYFSKLTSGLFLIAISQILLVLYILLAGTALRFLKPGMGFQAPIPVLDILGYAAVGFVSSWFLIGLHTYVGIRWKNFVVAMGFGIAMTVAGFLILNSRWAGIYPWTLPGLVLNKLKSQEPFLWQLCLGGPAALLPALLGAWEFVRRDIL